MKKHLNEEGSESVTKCNRLKMEAVDSKKYIADAANPETLLRLIQSAARNKIALSRCEAPTVGGGLPNRNSAYIRLTSIFL